mgnify:CR=1 FL=1
MQEIIDNTQKFANKIIKNNTTYQKAKDSPKDKPTGKTEEATVNEENKTIFNNKYPNPHQLIRLTSNKLTFTGFTFALFTHFLSH